MFATFFDSEITSILQEVENRSNQKFLNSKIDIPKPSTLKIGLLYLFLYTQYIPANKIRSICIATTLAQMGLDIHEWVANDYFTSSQKIEKRQLQVLAGDYYSSQYFSLLSSLGAIDEIRLISLAIRKHNQQKIHLYQYKGEHPNYLEKWLKLKVEVETALIKGFVNESNQVWNTLMTQFFAVDFLLSTQEFSVWSPAYLNKKVQGVMNEIRKCINQINQNEVSEELIRILRPYERTLLSTLVAEEI